MAPTVSVRKIAQLSGHNAAIFALSGDALGTGAHFLSGAGDGWIVRWDLDAPETGRLLARVETRIFSMCPLPDLRKIVAGNMNGGIHWIDLDDPERTRNIAHHNKGVFGICRVGDRIFTVGGDGILTHWSVPEGRSVESIHLSNQPLRCIDYHPQRHEIAVGASDNAIYILDADTLSIRHHIAKAHDNSVFAVRYAPDGSFLLSGGRDAHLRIREVAGGYREVSVQPAHWFTINDIAFHPDGHLFATASRDKTIRIWDAASFQLLKVLDTIRDGCHINSVNRLYWSGHRNELISGSDDRSMIIWEIR